MITTRPGASPRLPWHWLSAPTCWSITATRVLTLATVLGAAGDVAGARAAAERAVESVRAQRRYGAYREGARHSRCARPSTCTGAARSRARRARQCVRTSVGSRRRCRQSRGLGRGRSAHRPIISRRESPEDSRLPTDRRLGECNGHATDDVLARRAWCAPPHGSGRPWRASCPHPIGDGHRRLSPGAPRDEML